jgi:formylglycine-generating enzyme required for sulfatase activity
VRLGFRFVPIPAARFSMGSSSGEPEERPVHDVQISRPFCFGKTEVTQAQWRGVMRSNPSSIQGDDLPVTNVSWEDAQVFLAKLNAIDPAGRYRLPTEAEWEYSARLGSGRSYGFGNDAKLLRWFGNCYAADDRDGFRRLAPVQEFEPNRWGIYGLHGNASEWVSDRFDLYSSKPAVDPQGPEEGVRRVRRGGSYRTNARNCSATARFTSEPTLRQGTFGLRVVRAPVSKTSRSNVPD